MSDTVRFMTVNDTATPAKSSGANGFPFPANAGSDADHPLAISIPDDAFKFWWRVKNWSLSSSWSCTDGTTTATFTNGIMTPSGATTELDLIDPNSPHNFGFPFSTTSAGLLSIYTPAGVAAPQCFLNAGVYNPYLSLSGNGITTQLNAGTTFVRFAFNQADLTNLTGSFVATLDSYDVTCYYDATTSPPSNFTPGNMDFTPTAFWPYAQYVNNLPVYNATTGDVIPGRSPTA